MGEARIRKIELTPIKTSDKKSDNRYCIYVRGGLGDTIRQYFDSRDGWEYLSNLKQQCPDSIVKLMTFSANPQVPHFYRYHPHIDEIYQGSWVYPHCDATKLMNTLKGKEYKYLSDGGFEKNGQKRLYLSKDDQKIVDDIKSCGEFVVLHPFAGEPSRVPMPVKEYFPLINQISKLGFKTIIVGANWIRGKTTAQSRSVKEHFPYEHPNLINLIDKANARIVCQLILESKCLISSRSYCFAMTKSHGVKSVLVVPNSSSWDRKNTMHNIRVLGWSKYQVRNTIKIVESNPKSFNDTRKRIVSNFKTLIA